MRIKPAVGILVAITVVVCISLQWFRPDELGVKQEKPRVTSLSKGAQQRTPAKTVVKQPTPAQQAVVAGAAGAVVVADPVQGFADWSADYMKADTTGRVKMIAAGVEMAKARRPVFKQMIQQDPETALVQAVPMVVRQALPAEIMAQLEERVAAAGELRLYGASPEGVENGESPFLRYAETRDGTTYEAHVYGRRAAEMRQVPRLSIMGVALDGDLALSDSPLRRLEPGEIPDVSKKQVEVCPVSGLSTAREGEASAPVPATIAAVETGEEIVYLCDGAHISQYENGLRMGEGATGGAQSFTGAMPAAAVPSVGVVKVLYVPGIFADQGQVPASEATCQDVLRQVAEFYQTQSFGRLTLVATVTPPVRLPRNQAWYKGKDTTDGAVGFKEVDGLGAEMAHAKEAARAMGYDWQDYHCFIIRANGGARSPTSYGSIGSGQVWMRNDGVSTVAHEVGHAFGLTHANFWLTNGASVIGPGGSEEYGDIFDNMGTSSPPSGHYNVQAKNQVRWLPDEFAPAITQSGLYRIHAMDTPRIEPGKRYVLRVTKDDERAYWGELRTLWPSNSWASNGLILGWKWPTTGEGQNVQLLDTTPGSINGKNDCPIALGNTFSDTESGIHITTVAVNSGTTPPSLDVQVNLGSFVGNQPPVLALSPAAPVVPTSVNVSFTATASDPDNDTLAYSWRWHDGVVSPNSPTVTRSFSTSGIYTVSCVVSDMRGGIAVCNAVITVGNGNTRYTIRGRLTQNGVPMAGFNMTTSGLNGTLTDSDGRYVISNLAAGTYTVTPAGHGWQFNELFNNNITVGPSFDGADFTADTLPVVTVTAPGPVAVEGGVNGIFRLSRTGPTTQPLVVYTLLVRGTATKTTDYTFTPDYSQVTGTAYWTFTIPAGAADLDISVAPVNDAVAEGDETIRLLLGMDATYVNGASIAATITLQDNDTALPRVFMTTDLAQTVEGSGQAVTVTLLRSGGTGGTGADLVVPYVISPTGTATNGTDFASLSGTATILANSASTTFAITPLDDALAEGTETVRLSLTTGATLIADSAAGAVVVRLVDDDTQTITLTVGDATATEVDRTQPGAVPDPATFVITRSNGDLSQPLTVYYSVAGTALHGVDYDALPGSVTIPAGETQRTVTIMPRTDDMGEGPETVILSLADGNDAYRAGSSNSGSITISNNGSLPSLEVMASSAIAAEPSSNGAFRITAKGGSGTVVVNYTVSGTATVGTDYTALPGSVSITLNGGTVTKDITVAVLNDATLEEMETVVLTITPNTAAYTLWDQTGTATLQLRDDDQPTVFVDPQVGTGSTQFIVENSTSTVCKFYISRTGSTASALAVNYSLAGTATNGTDHSTLSGTATIAAGFAGVDVSFNTLNDSTFEGTETVTLHLESGSYARGPDATVYITDDEAGAQGVAFATEGSNGSESTDTVQIPVSLTSPATTPVTVQYAMDTGARTPTLLSGRWVRVVRTGTSFDSYTSLDGSTWTKISITRTVAMVSTSYLAGLAFASSVSGTGMQAMVDNVSVTGLSAGGSAGTLTPASIGTVLPAPGYVATGGVYRVVGGGTDVTTGTTDTCYHLYFPITNSANCTLTARVLNFGGSNSNMKAGVMVRETTATSSRHFSSFIDGSGNQRQIYRATASAAGVNTLAAAFTSLAKPVWLRLTRSGSSLSAFTSTDGTTFTPHGVPQPLELSPLLQAGIFVSSRTDGTLAQATFDNVTLDPPAALPFRSQSVGFVNEPGSHTESSGVFTVTGSGAGFLPSNTATEDEGQFVQVPASGNFTLTARVTALTAGPANAQAGLAVRETSNYRARAAVFFVSGSTASVADFRARLSGTSSGEGFGVDYRLDPGTLSFAIGEQTKYIPLQVTNDKLPEPPEFVSLLLSYPYAAQLGTPSTYTYTILDDDGASGVLPAVGFASVTTSAAETQTTGSVIVTLSEASSSTVTVDYSSADGSATGGGVDYTGVSGTLTFAPGETFKTISVPVINDSLAEASETFTLTLSGQTNAVLSTTSQHTYTIVDDDTPVVTLIASDPTANEAGDTGAFTFSRTGPTTSDMVVNFTRTGTATSGSDYSAIVTPGTFTIPVGQAAAVLPVSPLQNATAEADETVILTLAAGSGYTVGTPSTATVTIADDDVNTLTLTASDATASEAAGNPGEFTLSRSGPTTSSLNVTLAITGTATGGTDYATIGTTQTFAIGVSSITIPVTVTQDSATEGNEEIVVSISTSASYIVGTPSVANVTIIDDDLPPSVFISSPAGKSTIINAANGLMLLATATDDGLPSPLTYAWTQIFGPGTITFGTPAAAGTSATFSVADVYGLRITVSDGQFSASDTLIVQAGGFAYANWIGIDQGPPGVRGISGESATGVLTLVGNGTGYTGTNDSGHMLFRQLLGGTGDCTLIARLTSLTGPGTRLAGLTVRDTSWKGAKRALLVVDGGSNLQFHNRTTAGGTDSSVTASGLGTPRWLRLVRAGGVITASSAPDSGGAPGTWEQIGSPTNITMGANVSVGFVVSAGASTTATATAQFDNVIVTPAFSGTAVHSEDFGSSPLPGDSTDSGGTVTINAVGTHDTAGGHFRYQQVWGDCAIIARLTGQSGATRNAQAGVAVRDTMDTGVFAFYGQTTIDGFQAHWRSTAGATYSMLDGNGAVGGWVRLIRKGNNVTAYYASNNNGSPGTWSQTTGSLPIPMGGPMLVGLAVDSNSTTLTGTGTFTNLSITPLNTAPVISMGTVAPVAPFQLSATVTDDGQPSSPGTTALAWSQVGGPGPVLFTTPTQSGTLATLSQSGGPYTLRLTADDGDAVTFGTLAFTGYLTPFAQWLAQNGISLNLDAPGQSTADTDFDGQANLLEYAFGTPLQTPGTTPLVNDTATFSTEKYLRLTVPKNSAATDVTFTVEATSDLTNPASWSSTGLVTELDTVTQLKVRDSMPMSSGGPRFMRVKVVRQ